MVPLFDGVGAYAEAGGGLVQADQAAGSQALLAWRELVLDADVVDDPGVELLAGPGCQTTLVELVGNAGLGVIVEELVDLGDDGLRGAADLVGGQAGVGLDAGGLAVVVFLRGSEAAQCLVSESASRLAATSRLSGSTAR